MELEFDLIIVNKSRYHLIHLSYGTNIQTLPQTVLVAPVNPSLELNLPLVKNALLFTNGSNPLGLN